MAARIASIRKYVTRITVFYYTHSFQRTHTDAVCVASDIEHKYPTIMRTMFYALVK